MKLRPFMDSKNMFSTYTGRLRLAGMAEAISFLVLLFIAMPLKYLAHWEYGVKVVGMAHGILFLTYMLFLAQAIRPARLGLKELVMYFIAAFIPAGPFFVDARLKAAEEREIAISSMES